MRIMIVGDSISVGTAGDHTWRYRLWRHLAGTAGEDAFRLVGPRSALHDPVADADVSHDYAAGGGFPAHARRHLAGWGRGWLHMAPLVGPEVARQRADTLLVALGLIDLGFYTGPAQTIGNVRRFVDAARAAAPGVRMVLMPVVPNVRAHTDPPFMAQVAEFNARAAEAVAELSTAASPLVLARPPRDWDLERDTRDGTHLSARGEHRVAESFAAALEPWIPAGGAGVPGGGSLAAAAR